MQIISNSDGSLVIEVSSAEAAGVRALVDGLDQLDAAHMAKAAGLTDAETAGLHKLADDIAAVELDTVDVLDLRATVPPVTAETAPAPAAGTDTNASSETAAAGQHDPNAGETAPAPATITGPLSTPVEANTPVGPATVTPVDGPAAPVDAVPASEATTTTDPAPAADAR